MPFDRERPAEKKPFNATDMLDATCAGIPQCSIRMRDYRPGKCQLEGCPRITSGVARAWAALSEGQASPL